MFDFSNDHHVNARNKSILLWVIPGIIYLSIFILLILIIFGFSMYQVPFFNFLSKYIDVNSFFSTIAFVISQNPGVIAIFIIGKVLWLVQGFSTYHKKGESSKHQKKVSFAAFGLSILFLLTFISVYFITIFNFESEMIFDLSIYQAFFISLSSNIPIDGLISILPFNIPLNYAIIGLFFILLAILWLLTRLFSFNRSEKSSTSGKSISFIFFLFSFLFLIVFVPFYFNVMPDFEGAIISKIAILVIPIMIFVMQYFSIRYYPFGHKFYNDTKDEQTKNTDDSSMCNFDDDDINLLISDLKFAVNFFEKTKEGHFKLDHAHVSVKHRNILSSIIKFGLDEFAEVIENPGHTLVKFSEELDKGQFVKKINQFLTSEFLCKFIVREAEVFKDFVLVA